jgi:hypothetical protein
MKLFVLLSATTGRLDLPAILPSIRQNAAIRHGNAPSYFALVFARNVHNIPSEHPNQKNERNEDHPILDRHPEKVVHSDQRI